MTGWMGSLYPERSCPLYIIPKVITKKCHNWVTSHLYKFIIRHGYKSSINYNPSSNRFPVHHVSFGCYMPFHTPHPSFLAISSPPADTPGNGLLLNHHTNELNNPHRKDKCNNLPHQLVVAEWRVDLRVWREKKKVLRLGERALSMSFCGPKSMRP